MKNFVLFLSISFGSISAFLSQMEPLAVNLPSTRKIQMAILFDASNSMDGLLNQAKSKLWNIVNELSSLQYEGQSPTIEISLYKYGHDDLSSSSHYIQQLVPLSTDLDLISQQLFGITTHGGSEFCGAVMSAALSELNWSPLPSDLKMLYIAGNEIFNQGTIDYREVCKMAASRQIYVNTIYCGNYDQGVKHLWYDGAQLGQGDYFNIDPSKIVKRIETPYDAKINAYNDSINRTYYSYGTEGVHKKNAQAKEDMNAEIQSAVSKTERSIVKSKAAYSNPSWDLIDAATSGKDITKIVDTELPSELQGKTAEEKTAFIEKTKVDREAFQQQINALAKERKNFIEEEMKKQVSTSETDDFGTSVNKSILTKANAVGLKKVDK
jgi:hypothetical protein